MRMRPHPADRSGRIRLLLCVFVLLPLAITGCNGYGKELKFKKGQLFYTSKVTKDEADKLGNYLVKEGFFTDMKEITVQLNKSGSTYEFRMVVLKGMDQ